MTVESMNTDNRRKVRALAIVAQADTIERIDARNYRVKSQSGNGWYHVRKEGGEWKCECPDFGNRGVVCKHIFAVNYSTTLRDRALSQNFFEPLQLPEIKSMACPRCGSPEVISRGKRKNKMGDVQRFGCKVCGHRWVINEGFIKMKHEGRIVSLALDLYFKKNSLRQIADSLGQGFKDENGHDVEVEPSTILRWVQKYVEVAREFVDGLKPDLSGILHVDEMKIHVRGDKSADGHYAWLWNLADHDTRFLLASRVSKRREVKDARAVFQHGKKLLSKRPIAVVHDGLQSYNDAFRKEFYRNKGPQTQNIRSVGQRDKGLNQSIERINGTIRDREKVMRGMHTDKSAQIQADGMRVNYDWLRPNMGLDGKTPAQAAGLDLGLGLDDGIRWQGLIKKATLSKP